MTRAAVVAVVLAACGSKDSAPPPAPPPPAPSIDASAPEPPKPDPTPMDVGCNRDAECEKVPSSCCGCADRAILLARMKDYQDTVLKDCHADVGCKRHAGNPPECMGDAVCVDHKCVVALPKP